MDMQHLPRTITKGKNLKISFSVNFQVILDQVLQKKNKKKIVKLDFSLHKNLAT